MASASQKHEQDSHFGFGTDNCLSFQNERSRQRAVKLGAVTVDGRIDGIQHSYFQDRASRKGVQCISGCWIKTGLQMKLQDSARSDSNRCNGWRLRISDSRK